MSPICPLMCKVELESIGKLSVIELPSSLHANHKNPNTPMICIHLYAPQNNSLLAEGFGTNESEAIIECWYDHHLTLTLAKLTKPIKDKPCLIQFK